MNADLFGAMFNHDERCLGNTETENGFLIDTSFAPDRELYETAISHKRYNGGKWIVIGWAPDIQSALDMHDNFCKTYEFFGGNLPRFILDAYENKMCFLEGTEE